MGFGVVNRSLLINSVLAYFFDQLMDIECLVGTLMSYSAVVRAHRGQGFPQLDNKSQGLDSRWSNSISCMLA